MAIWGERVGAPECHKQDKVAYIQCIQYNTYNSSLFIDNALYLSPQCKAKVGNISPQCKIEISSICQMSNFSNGSATKRICASANFAVCGRH